MYFHLSAYWLEYIEKAKETQHYPLNSFGSPIENAKKPYVFLFFNVH